MAIIDLSIVEKIETSLAILTKRTDGIIEYRFKVDEYEVDVAEQFEFQEAYNKLTDNGNVSYPVLVIPGHYGGITKEARELDLFQTGPLKNAKCFAIVITSLHQRLLATAFFTLKKKKYTTPYQFFRSEKEAVEWIMELRNKK